MRNGQKPVLRSWLSARIVPCPRPMSRRSADSALAVHIPMQPVTAGRLPERQRQDTVVKSGDKLPTKTPQALLGRQIVEGHEKIEGQRQAPDGPSPNPGGLRLSQQQHRDYGTRAGAAQPPKIARTRKDRYVLDAGTETVHCSDQAERQRAWSGSACCRWNTDG